MSAGLILDRAAEVQRRLADAGVDSAVGGALALGFHVDDPRGTQDVDLNLSVGSAAAQVVLDALPTDVRRDDYDLDAIRADDQVRLWWPTPTGPPMPLDLFFAVARPHELAVQRAVGVRVADVDLRVLSATDLAVFKALYDRPKDWIDIDAMRDAHDASLDVGEAADLVAGVVGQGDARVRRLRSLL